MADSMAVLSRFSDRLRELSRTNPDRWGDLDRVAEVLDEEIRYEFEDDE